MDIKTILTKITDTVTIIFPALVAVLGVLGIAKAVPIAENVEQVTLIVLGVASSGCSVWFNQLARKPL